MNLPIKTFLRLKSAVMWSWATIRPRLTSLALGLLLFIVWPDFESTALISMSLAGVVNQSVRALDEFCSGVQVRMAERRGGLIGLCVHNVFTDVDEIERELAYPQQSLTLANLEQIIQTFQAVGYTFVSPKEIITGLSPNERYALLTFDDGYFNNRRALPLLEKYRVPAIFFISAQMVAEGRVHWWDWLYRARIRQGRSRAEVFAEIAGRVGGCNEELEANLAAQLDVSEFKFVSNTDRLFSPAELREFASHPLVSIGNHGCAHEYLPAYSSADVAERLKRAQAMLHEMSDQVPEAIAYPYGAFSEAVVDAAHDAGLRLGFTTIGRKEYVSQLNDDAKRRMQLGRFTIWGDTDIERQSRFMRGDLLLHGRYRKLVDCLKERLY